MKYDHSFLFYDSLHNIAARFHGYDPMCFAEDFLRIYLVMQELFKLSPLAQLGAILIWKTSHVCVLLSTKENALVHTQLFLSHQPQLPAGYKADKNVLSSYFQA